MYVSKCLCMLFSYKTDSVEEHYCLTVERLFLNNK